MSGNKGLNFNQNPGQGARISTRVLAPPGGGSSFSLGGYTGPTYAPAKSSPVKKSYNSGYVGTIGSSADDMNYKAFKNQFDSRPEYNRSPRREARQMRDSLDNEMGNYGQKKSPMRYNPMGGGSMGRNDNEHKPPRANTGPSQMDSIPRSSQPNGGPLRKEDYAEILRQQIMSNKGVDTGRKIGRTQQNREPSYENPYAIRESRRSVPQVPVIGGRRGSNPSAARTTFSLNWDC